MPALCIEMVLGTVFYDMFYSFFRKQKLQYTGREEETSAYIYDCRFALIQTNK